MDSRDRLRLRLVGTGCGACGSVFPAEAIRVLAQRDDLAFVQLHCPDCGTDALALVTDGESDDVAATMDDVHAGWLPGRVPGHRDLPDLRRAEPGGPGTAPPISSDDVLAVHQLLAAHHGDMRSLLRRTGRGSSRS